MGTPSPLFVKFGVSGAFILLFGLIVTQSVWTEIYRYESPDVGRYYGHLQGTIDIQTNDFALLAFTGETEPRWQVRGITNFSYPSLTLELVDGKERKEAVLDLRANALIAEGAPMDFSVENLGRWLGDGTSTNMTRSIHAFFKSANEGSLPGPRHHGYRLEDPIPIMFRHFQLGIGFGWISVSWIIAWAVGIALIGRKYFGAGSFPDKASRRVGAADERGRLNIV